MKDKLYLVSTFGCGSYYVVASDSLEAEEKVSHHLEKNHLGFADGKEIETITTIAEEGKIPKNSWEKGPSILIK